MSRGGGWALLREIRSLIKTLIFLNIRAFIAFATDEEAQKAVGCESMAVSEWKEGKFGDKSKRKIDHWITGNKKLKKGISIYIYIYIYRERERYIYAN